MATTPRGGGEATVDVTAVGGLHPAEFMELRDCIGPLSNLGSSIHRAFANDSIKNGHFSASFFFIFISSLR